MAEFYNRSNLPPRTTYPISEKVVPTYGLKIDKTTGKKTLQKTGQTNIYEKIQAAKESTQIYNILERYQNGDLSVLEQGNGQYGDFTTLPENLAEAQQLIINAEETFNKLPIEIRKEFNMSPTEFMAGAANGKLQEILMRDKKIEQEQKVENQEEQIQQPQQGVNTQYGTI